MAASHRQICERARTRWDKASSAFNSWAIANGFGHVRRSEIEVAMTGNTEGLALFAADNAAHQVLTNAESAAVSAGAAWRGTFGMVNFYSAAEMRRFSRRSA